MSKIASFVADSGHEILNPAIAACRLVCSTFAKIFPPHQFEFLDLSNVGSGCLAIYRMLEQRIFLLIENPEVLI